MNDWRVHRFRWDDSYVPDRGKVFDAEQLDRMQAFYRYLDVDGDGIAARTLPGVHPKGAYFTRGSGHTKLGGYTEDAADYVEVMERLARKIANAAGAVPAPVVRGSGSARIGLVTLGGCNAAVMEAADRLAARGIELDYLRVRGFPFAAAIADFLNRHELVFVVEQNRDGQLQSLLQLETGVSPEKLRPIRDFGGTPLSAQVVVEAVLAQLGVQEEHAAPIAV